MQAQNQGSHRDRIPRMPAVNAVDSPANPSPVLSRLKRLHENHIRNSSAQQSSGGCISEQSLPRNSHDSSDYQAILKVFGDLLTSGNRDTIDAILLPDGKAAITTVSSYDADGLSIDTSKNQIFDGHDVSDDEIEECAYLGWISN